MSSKIMASTSTGPPCRLLNLPPELRNRIYEEVFQSATTHNGKTNLVEAKPPEKALLLTCKLIYREAKNLHKSLHRQYWTTNTFTLRRPQTKQERQHVIRAFRPADWNHITSITYTSIPSNPIQRLVYIGEDAWDLEELNDKGEKIGYVPRGHIERDKLAEEQGFTGKHCIRLKLYTLPCGRTRAMLPLSTQSLWLADTIAPGMPAKVEESLRGAPRCSLRRDEMTEKGATCHGDNVRNFQLDRDRRPR